MILLALLAVVVSCDVSTRIGGTAPFREYRVVNAYTSPVDILVDGNVVAAALTPGDMFNGTITLGTHTLALRSTGSSTPITQPLIGAVAPPSTIAAVRASTGALSSAVLDDTNTVVDANATKVRVLHLAPNAAPLQIYRTQPDVHTPVAWLGSPLSYEPNPTSQNIQYVASTVGSWEIRAWQSPADSSGWDTAPAKVLFLLPGGQKATVLILDKAGGGVRLLVI